MLKQDPEAIAFLEEHCALYGCTMAPASSWQPFETAPKDGRLFLAKGIWKPFEVHKGGQTHIALARWNEMRQDFGIEKSYWCDPFMPIAQVNVAWESWSELPE